MNTRHFNELINHLVGLKKPEEMKDFIRGILTPKELEEVTNRLQIVKMLKAGIPQKLIAEKLGVGIATVTRGSKEVQAKRFKKVA